MNTSFSLIPAPLPSVAEGVLAHLDGCVGGRFGGGFQGLALAFAAVSPSLKWQWEGVVQNRPGGGRV